MINLLSERTQRSLRMAYYARFATVAALLCALAVFAGGALLAPSYFLAAVDEGAARDTLASSDRMLASESATGNEEVLAQAAEQVSLMKEYLRTPSIAAALSAFTARVPGGVVVSAVSVTPGAGGTDSVSLSGSAKTRNDLLSFADALRASSSLSGVSVPLSQLAGETDIKFTLSFSFAPHP